MDTVTIILVIISFIGLLLLIIGNMTDNGKMSTVGLIGLVLGVLFLFTYHFLSFISRF